MIDTPKKLGFILPAEWEKHSAVWLAWPHDKISFGSLNEPEGTTNEKRLSIVEKQYVEIIKTLAPEEDIEHLVLNDEIKTKVSTMLTEAGVNLKDISFNVADYADVWLRDYGPLFISNTEIHEQAWVKWTYDAYGEQFQDLLKDNEVFFKLRGSIGKRMFEPGLILESGAIEGNGKGTLITTEQCLLNSKRNPNIGKAEYEKYFTDYLNITKTIWLKKGLINDHTDGHIDEIARFVSPTKVLCAYEDDEQDENFNILDDNYNKLKSELDADKNPLEVIKLPMPHMKYTDGNKAPVSYCNFYIGNNVVLAAVFNDPNDTKALEIIQSCFPDRKVIPIDCSEIIYGGGAVHCMTQQQPMV